MIGFVFAMLTIGALVGLAAWLLDTRWSMRDQETDNQRRDADIADLRRQVLRLRRDRLPLVNRLPVDWWDGDLDDLEQQIVKRAS